MLSSLLLCCVLLCCSELVECVGDKGPGIWHVQYVQKCEMATHKLKVDLVQNKINRTHDGWNGRFIFEDPIDYGIAIHLEISKRVDGGYRLQQVISEPDFIAFVKKYAENNLKGFLVNAGIDPPDFPIAAGEYELKDYVLDYNELSKEAIYGEFCGIGFLRVGNEDIFCLEAYVDFNEEEDDEEDEE